MDSQDARRMAAVEARLTVIERHLGLGPGVGATFSDGTLAPPPSPEVMALVEAGNVLKAIGAYRAQTGCSMPDAQTVLQGLPAS
jgi:hypothetical protein